MPDYETEMFLMDLGYKNVIGIDEVARGNLLGNVYAAGVILTQDFDFSILKDSKKIPKKKIPELAEKIKSKNRWAVQSCTPEEIDQYNIFECTKTAMQKVVCYFDDVDYALIDGNMEISIDVPYRSIIKGDDKIYSIAAASIIAKAEQMKDLLKIHKEFPMYGLDTNSGYGTKKHCDSIVQFGPCRYHRKTFKRVREYV